jgi:hypothetical protein
MTYIFGILERENCQNIKLLASFHYVIYKPVAAGKGLQET